MISALLLSTLLGAADVRSAIREVQRTFLEDGDDRVSATATHRVVSHADGSLELQGAPSLRFSLQSVHRDRGAACRAVALSREIVPGARRTIRTRRACALDETWTNAPDGLEQTFTLTRAPAGAGGLRLRLAVDGPWHHQDRDGHVFGGPGAAEVLRYGNAFVVRRGQRLPIPVLHVEGGLELRVPPSLLDAPGAFPMVIDPVLSAEQPLDPSLVPALLASRESEPALAVDGAGLALVAWTDTRRQVQTDIFGARFDLNGLLDVNGLPLVTEPGHQRHPAVSWDGTSFLLAWEQEVQLVDGGLGGQVLARLVLPSGDAGLAAPLAQGTQPALAGVADGGYSLLAWVDGTFQARLARVGSDLVFTQYPSVLAVNSGHSSRPAIAANAKGAFLTWERSALGTRTSGIQGYWVGGTSLLDLSPDAGEARRPTVALLNNGTEQEAVVYWDEPVASVGGCIVRATQVIPVTSFVGTTPAVTRISEADGGGALGYVGLGGAVYVKDLIAGSFVNYSLGGGGRPADLALTASTSLFAVWTDGVGNDVYSASISLPIINGSLRTHPISTAPTMQLHPNVAMHGDQGLAVWIDGVSTIAGSRVRVTTSAVTFDSRVPLVTGTAPIEQLDLAAGPGQQFLVTWRQTDDFGSSLYAVLVDADQPGTAFQLSPTTSVLGLPTAVGGPAVAWDQSNQNYLVAWINQPAGMREVVTRTVSEANGLAPTLPRASGPATDVDVSCLGTTCLLAWGLRSGNTPGPTVESLVLGSLAAREQSTPGAEPSVTHDGADFFMAWRTDSGLGFARVDPSLGALTMLPGLISPNATVATQLSLSPAKPPIVAWTELSVNSSKVRLQQLGQPILEVHDGLFPVVATNGVPGPQGVIVYQRYLADLQTTHAFGMSFTFDAGIRPDAGVDGGVDAGPDVADGGSDAGPEGVDAGALTFHTSGCGCQSSSLQSVLVLALVLLRRRDPQRRGDA